MRGLTDSPVALHGQNKKQQGQTLTIAGSSSVNPWYILSAILFPLVTSCTYHLGPLTDLVYLHIPSISYTQTLESGPTCDHGASVQASHLKICGVRPLSGGQAVAQLLGHALQLLI